VVQCGGGGSCEAGHVFRWQRPTRLRGTRHTSHTNTHITQVPPSPSKAHDADWPNSAEWAVGKRTVIQGGGAGWEGCTSSNSFSAHATSASSVTSLTALAAGSTLLLLLEAGVALRTFAGATAAGAEAGVAEGTAVGVGGGVGAGVGVGVAEAAAGCAKEPTRARRLGCVLPSGGGCVLVS